MTSTIRVCVRGSGERIRQGVEGEDLQRKGEREGDGDRGEGDRGGHEKKNL